EPEQPDRELDETRKQGGKNQPFHPVKRDGHGHKDDKRARGASDLISAAAKKRDDEPADDRGVQAAVRAHSGSDGDRHRERYRHDGDGQPGQNIRTEILEPITFSKYRNEFWGEL